MSHVVVDQGSGVLSHMLWCTRGQGFCVSCCGVPGVRGSVSHVVVDQGSGVLYQGSGVLSLMLWWTRGQGFSVLCCGAPGVRVKSKWYTEGQSELYRFWTGSGIFSQQLLAQVRRLLRLHL